MENIVYHGSHNGNIEIIKAHVSTHQKKCIYATDNKVIAMLFMNKGMGDLDTIKRLFGYMKSKYKMSRKICFCNVPMSFIQNAKDTKRIEL